MSSLAQDLKQAVRLLSKNPGFSAMAILCLAVGIGFNSLIFSITNAIILRPLPFEHRDRLTIVQRIAPRGLEWLGDDVSGETFLDWRSLNESFADMAALTERHVTMTRDGKPLRLEAMLASPTLPEMVGVRALHGRLFDEAEVAAGHDRLTVLSHQLWQQEFGADPEVVGRRLVLDGEPFDVIGVLPPDLGFLDVYGELWLPLTKRELESAGRSVNRFGVVGLLREGTSLEQAQMEMNRIAEGLGQSYPEQEGGFSVRLISVVDELIKDFRQAVLILHVTVGFVLLVACANVANLLLARLGERRREMLLRTALGASRSRILRQLMIENLVLAVAGGVAGLAAAFGGLRLLLGLLPTDVPRLTETSIDLGVVTVTLVVSLATGVLFGLAPALQLAREEPRGGLRESASLRGRGSQSVLLKVSVVVAVAASMVLLVGADLLLKSLDRLQRTDPGFDPMGLMTVEIDLPTSRYPTPVEQRNFFRQAIERVAAVPNVTGVSMVSQLPLSDEDERRVFVADGEWEPQPGLVKMTQYRHIAADYFEVMGIGLRSGRSFTSADDAAAPPVVIVSELMARRAWGGRDAVGRKLTVRGGADGTARTAEVVGVVSDVKVRGLGLEEQPMVYVPYLQDTGRSASLVMRVDGRAEEIAAPARRAIASLDPDQSVGEAKPMSRYIEQDLLLERFSAVVLGCFAAAALVLAGLGLYGVMAFSVSQRRQEIGIRVALGAGPQDVLRLITSHSAVLVLYGLLIGLVVAALLSRGLTGLLFKVSALDPKTYLEVALGLLVVAVAACLIPAVRALRLDPRQALHE